MELVQTNVVTGTQQLFCTYCTPASNTFRLELRKSESVQKYSEICRASNLPEHPPDTLVAICNDCSNEITITDNSDQADAFHYAEDAFHKFGEEQERQRSETYERRLARRFGRIDMTNNSEDFTVWGDPVPPVLIGTEQECKTYIETHSEQPDLYLTDSKGEDWVYDRNEWSKA